MTTRPTKTSPSCFKRGAMSATIARTSAVTSQGSTLPPPALSRERPSYELFATAWRRLPFRGDRPPILNAAGSGEGRDFASRNADFLFTPAIDLERSRAGSRRQPEL